VVLRAQLQGAATWRIKQHDPNILLLVYPEYFITVAVTVCPYVAMVTKTLPTIAGAM